MSSQQGNESAQIAYNAAHKFRDDFRGLRRRCRRARLQSTISGRGNVLTRPDGSVFRMALYELGTLLGDVQQERRHSAHSITITIGAYK